MQEVFFEAIRPINLPWTVLVCAVAVYWLLVALGALGLDMEGDASGDATAGAEGGGWFTHMLQFLNVGEVPMTLVLSVLVLCLWLGSLVCNFYWTGHSLALGLAALVPNLLVSAVLTRLLTSPFKPLLRALDREGPEHLPVVGRTCLITTSEANAQFGQARIDTGGAPLLINVRTRHGAPLPRGATGLVVEQDKNRGLFYVIEISPDTLT